jgi:site-specific DNA-methyltransferase (adenine-specific)
MSSKLYLGDCLDVINSINGEIDAVITDPVWPNVPAGMFDVADPYILLHDCLEMIDAKRVVIIMRLDSDPRFLTAVPEKWPFFRTQTLSYRIPGYIGRKLGGEEFAYCFGSPVKFASGRQVIPGRGPSVGITPKDGHPCPRNLDHMRWLVNWWSDAGETVLDPFMGSGTTGVACAQTGRNFIGIEIDPEYFAIAEKRIHDAEQQPLLFAS